MQEVVNIIQRAVKKLFAQDVEVELTRPDEQFGDFATNIALQLAAKLGEKPRDIADQIAAAIQPDDTIKSVTVAGLGFINVTLTNQALSELAAQAAHTKPQTYAGKVVVAEYSDPNPFKVLHAGHLYTTLVGDSIASLLEAAGATVHRLNYGGDVGLHVGKAMWAIMKAVGDKPEALQDIPKAERANWISQRYVEGNAAYEQDVQAKSEIIVVNKQAYEVHATNDHESVFAKVYWTCREWSYEGFDALYEQLRIHPFEKYIPESLVTPKALELVEKGKKEGVFVESDGATVFKGEDHGLHTRVFVNSQGIPTYEAKDLGLAAMKWQDYQFDLSFIITGNDIVEYMKVVVKALSRFYPQVSERSTHLTHGMIRMPGNQKMSSRLGNILRGTDILDAAAEATRQATGADNANSTLAAVKYAFLKQRIGGDIIYNPAESVSLEGNSGPYLQYAHSRARSILEKAGKVEEPKAVDLDAAERSLARKMSEYPSVVDKAVHELMPHHICTYLFELAQSFNRFYEKNRVVASERQAVRVQLVGQYAAILKDGLELLNIPAPNRL